MEQPTLTIPLNGPLKEWAKNHADPVAVATQILLASIGSVQTPFDNAKEKFRENLEKFPLDFEFEIPQVIGSEHWEKLDRGSRLAMGKFIRANTDAYGITYVRTTKSRHTVYRRAA